MREGLRSDVSRKHSWVLYGPSYTPCTVCTRVGRRVVGTSPTVLGGASTPPGPAPLDWSVCALPPPVPE